MFQKAVSESWFLSRILQNQKISCSQEKKIIASHKVLHLSFIALLIRLNFQPFEGYSFQILFLWKGTWVDKTAENRAYPLHELIVLICAPISYTHTQCTTRTQHMLRLMIHLTVRHPYVLGIQKVGSKGKPAHVENNIIIFDASREGRVHQPPPS